MAIDVSREFEAELEDRLKSGRYRSAEELLREALHLVDQRDEIHEAVA
jgi:Arc/MetJ-type ribon-helix-helix transcriptional regulator